MNQQAEAFIRLASNRFKFSLFLLSKIPAAYFAGLRVKEIEYHHSKVTVPYKWFTQNPFRSTYFACQAMAAEMSTGLLAMMNTYKRKPGISMLVTKVEGEFFKKAVAITTFECMEGKNISEAVEACVGGEEACSITVKSTGTNAKGELVSIFYITWSFKVKMMPTFNT